MMRHMDRNQVWSVAKSAVHAYEKDPTKTNASRVAKAIKKIRKSNEEAVWRQAKGTRPLVTPARKDEVAERGS